jgi:hypothetical protein
MAKSETHDQVIESICDYRKGWTNIHSAFLDSMKSNSVTKIRGYSKEPEQLRKGKIGTANEAKR